MQQHHLTASRALGHLSRVHPAIHRQPLLVMVRGHQGPAGPRRGISMLLLTTLALLAAGMHRVGARRERPRRSRQLARWHLAQLPEGPQGFNCPILRAHFTPPPCFPPSSLQTINRVRRCPRPAAGVSGHSSPRRRSGGGRPRPTTPHQQSLCRRGRIPRLCHPQWHPADPR